MWYCSLVFALVALSVMFSSLFRAVGTVVGRQGCQDSSSTIVVHLHVLGWWLQSFVQTFVCHGLGLRVQSFVQTFVCHSQFCSLAWVGCEVMLPVMPL